VNNRLRYVTFPIQLQNDRKFLSKCKRLEYVVATLETIGHLVLNVAIPLYLKLVDMNPVDV
jgi:hypothetical protein